MIDLDIAGVTCACLVAGVLFKPSIRIHNREINIYWVISVIGAVFIIALGSLSLKEAFQDLFGTSSINPIEIITLFISMTILSIYLDEVGFFEKVAYLALGRAHASQKKLFLYLYVFISVLTVFTSNDIIILTFTPFICYFASNAILIV